MNIYTSGEYHRRHPSGGTEDAQWKAGQIERMIRRRGLRFQSAAEVGCGSGEILANLSIAFPKATFLGCDIAPSLRALWSERENARVRFHCGDFFEGNDTFDLLLMIDVFEHVPDYMGFLTAARERARHHIFHIPLELSAQGILRDVPMRAREDVGHLHYFSRTTALATLADCGYAVLESVYTNAAIDRAKTRRAKALNVVRKPMYRLFPELTVRLLGGWSLLVLAEGRGNSPCAPNISAR
jgi:SAM-dependent methyltransferase